MPGSTVSPRSSRRVRTQIPGGSGRRHRGTKSVKSLGSVGMGYAKQKLQEELKIANAAAERARQANIRKNKQYQLVQKDMDDRRRAKEKVE